MTEQRDHYHETQKRNLNEVACLNMIAPETNILHPCRQ